ncbi:peptide chain release factor N(5)-glutamine methyltransferase [candidate division WOR-3 bacterium]|nr:peptide chain release factor N(5)-glutamine methyltransferase [candidate division WOR-3 bacterium]
MQVKEVLKYTTQSLQNKGIDKPELEAEILISQVLKFNRVSLYSKDRKNLSDFELDNIFKTIKRRLNHEPLQYLTHKVNFLGFDFLIDAPTFIPRPETEIIVQTLLKQVGAYRLSRRAKADNTPLLIFDIGTGCGVIAIACLKLLPQATAYVSDIIDLKLAKQNAEMLGVSNRINFICGNLLDPFKLNEKADFIVSNPPYIPISLISTLQPEIRLFESRSSIDGGEEGLVFIYNLIKETPLYLKPSGILLLEISPEQKSKVENKALDYFKEVDFIRDFSNNFRVLVAKCI